MSISQIQFALGQRNCFIKQFLYLGFFVLLFKILAPPAFAVSIGIAGNYNAFIHDDFSGAPTIQGRLAAGGDVVLKGYTVGSKLPTDTSGTTNTLVIGGNLTLGNGNIYNGNAVVGGTVHTNSPYGSAKNGSLYENSAVPIDFKKEFASLRELSRQISEMTANGTVENRWGGTYLTTDSTSMIQVFDIEGSSLSSTHTFAFDNADMPENATLLFNVSGKDKLAMKNFGMDDFMKSLGSSYDNVLFNFYEATELDLGGIGIRGSILAPSANIKTSGGDLYGTIIANSWKGSMTLHNVPFEGTPSKNFTPVPEPTSALLLGIGLLGFAAVLRRKN